MEATRPGLQTVIGRLIEIDARSLATFRISLAAVILADLIILRIPDTRAFYADHGMYPFSVREEIQGQFLSWSLHTLHGGTFYQGALFALAGVLAACLLIGFRTRFVTIGLWVLTVSLANRNLPACNYGDTILRLFLFWSIFLPLNSTWSWDARRRRRRVGAASVPRGVRTPATACILLQLSLVYFFAGLWKLNSDWVSGEALRHALLLEYATRDSSRFLLQFPALIKPLTRATLVLELAGPLLVWSPWATRGLRILMIAAFVALHASIECFFTPGLLSYVCVSGWLLFLPGSFWESALLQNLGRIGKSLLRPTRAEIAPGGQPVPAVPRSRVGVAVDRLSGATCLLMLVYVLLWNVATLDVGRCGLLIPPKLRWIGHATMMRQTWDMFYIPSRHNGWYAALALLEDGTTVDLFRGAKAVADIPVTASWSEMPNPRWRFFLRRVGAEGCGAANQPMADYLLREWNREHSGPRRAERIDLIYYLWIGDPSEASRGFQAETVATSRTAESSRESMFLRKLERFGQQGFLP